MPSNFYTAETYKTLFLQVLGVCYLSLVIVKAQLPGIYGSKPIRVWGRSPRAVYIAINPWQLGFNYHNISHLIGLVMAVWRCALENTIATTLIRYVQAYKKGQRRWNRHVRSLHFVWECATGAAALVAENTSKSPPTTLTNNCRLVTVWPIPLTNSMRMLQELALLLTLKPLLLANDSANSLTTVNFLNLGKGWFQQTLRSVLSGL